MAAPTALPNAEKIFRCVQYQLGQITNANGYYTDGMVVDRDRDPTIIYQDLNELLKTKCCVASIGMGAEEIDPHRTGGVRRWVLTYPIMVFRALKESERVDDGKTLSQVVSELIDDFKSALESDGIRSAADALAATYPDQFPLNPANGQRLSCIGHHVVAVQTTSEAIQYPMATFDVICQVAYDRAI